MQNMIKLVVMNKKGYMPMSLFKSKQERQRQKREKQRKRRAAKYERDVAKRERKTKLDKEVNKKTSGFTKTLDFIDDLIGIFSPSHARITHDRLVKQGLMLTICAAVFVAGAGICYQSHEQVEYRKSQAANFMTDDLSFSKSGTAVATKTPFTTQDRKTLYIPLKIDDMKLIDPDASEYHVLILAKGGAMLKSKITQAQLISYGSTGVMYLVVKSANKFQSQPVQFLIWSGSDITNDKFDPSSNDNDSLTEFKSIAKKYDTLGFTINLGGGSVKPIPKTKTIVVKDTVYKRDPKTHKKVKTIKSVKQQIPIAANKALYNDDTALFLYNHVVTGPQMVKQRASMKRKYDRMQLAINRINKDVRALTKAGYILPKLPKWTTNRGNDIAHSLPFSYSQLASFDLLEPNTTFTPKQQKLLAEELRVYNKRRHENGSNISSTKEENYAADLANKIIHNKHVDKTLGNGSGDSDDDSNSSNNDEAEWTELQNEIAQIATLKKELYYQKPLTLWSMYQDFILATSSGKDKNANTGAITYSNLSGHNKHGNYLTIYGLPSNKSKK